MSLLSKSWSLVRVAGRRTMMTDAPVGASSSAGGNGALVGAVGTTFVTYMCADFLSNFLLHPTQKVREFHKRSLGLLLFFVCSLKLTHNPTFRSSHFDHTKRQMDYGYFNKFLDREVDRAWWGTRTEHIVGVAAALAVTDHASQRLFSQYLGRPLCFAKSPAAFVAHTFFFIFTGVTLYVAADSAWNPDIEQDQRGTAFAQGTYSSAVGSCTAWYEPYVSPALARVAGPALASSWFGSSLLPATLAYSTVKGVGWNDWGNAGLSHHELRLNGLSPTK